MSTHTDFFRNLFVLREIAQKFERSLKRQEKRSLTFEQLEERLALNSAPIINGIPDVINLTPGTSYHVALDGEDADNDRLTYTVQSTNDSLLTATVLEGNESVKFTVYTRKLNSSDQWESMGEIIIELFDKEAPITTQRMKDIINGKITGKDGKVVSYDGVAIHRIIDGFVFQGGDVEYGDYNKGYNPGMIGRGGSGNQFADEYNDLLQHSGRGIVSTANSNSPTANPPVLNTNDTQFFITDNATSYLDGRHNVFGFVTEGDDVRKKVNEIPATTQSAYDSGGTPTTKDVKMDDFEIFTDYENGTLRLVVPKDAKPGTSTVTVMVSDGVNDPVPYTFTVNVIAEVPSSKPEWSVPRTLDLDAGQQFILSLPEYPVYGEVDYYSEVIAGKGLKLTQDDRDVIINVPKVGGGVMWIDVQAIAKDQDAAYSGGGSAAQYIYLMVTPSAPTMKLLASSDTGTAGDNVTSKNGSTGNELLFEISGVVRDYTEVNIYRDGYEVDYEVVSMILDTETDTRTYTVKVIGDATGLADGTYSYTARQTYTPAQDFSHAAMTSEASAGLAIVIDTKNPVFTKPQPDTIVDATVGKEVRLEFQTDDQVAGKTKFEIASVKDLSGNVIDIPAGMKIDGYFFSWTPTASQVDEYTIEIKATDGAGNFSSRTFQILFQNGPNFTITGETTINEGAEFILELAIDDDDFEGEVSYSLREDSLPSNIEYTIDKTGDQTAVFKWMTTEADGPGTYKPVFIVRDSEGNARRKDATLTVNELDASPEFTNEFKGIYNLLENDEFRLQLSATDSDIYPSEANTLIYSIVGNKPDGLEIDSQTGLITWTPDESQGGYSFEITVRVTDKTGLFDENVVHMLVEEDDSAPVFAESESQFAKNTGQAFNTNVEAKDPDYRTDPTIPINRIAYSLEGDDIPGGMTINSQTGEISWTIPLDYLGDVLTGSVSVTVIAQEVKENGELGLSTTKTIEIDLTNQMILDAIANEAREAAEEAARRAMLSSPLPITGNSDTDSFWMHYTDYGNSAISYQWGIDPGPLRQLRFGDTLSSNGMFGIDGTHTENPEESDIPKNEFDDSTLTPQERELRRRSQIRPELPAVNRELTSIFDQPETLLEDTQMIEQVANLHLPANTEYLASVESTESVPDADSDIENAIALVLAQTRQ